MIPSQVRHKKDGTWYPWVAGTVDRAMFKLKCKTANGEPIYVNGVVVYELKFEDGSTWRVT